MDKTQIRTFSDWLGGGYDNGYCFRSSIRLVPGDNAAFYWKPLRRPAPEEQYAEVRVFERRGDGSLNDLGQTVHHNLIFARADEAIRLSS